MKKVNLELKYSDIKDNEVLKINGKFYRLVVCKIEAYSKTKYEKPVLRKIKNLEELEEAVKLNKDLKVN